MDDSDRKRISLLRKDARMTAAALVAKLGVSRGTIASRLHKREGEQMKVRMSVVIESNLTRAAITVLLDESTVEALHDTNGDGIR